VVSRRRILGRNAHPLLDHIADFRTEWLCLRRRAAFAECRSQKSVVPLEADLLCEHGYVAHVPEAEVSFTDGDTTARARRKLIKDAKMNHNGDKLVRYSFNAGKLKPGIEELATRLDMSISELIAAALDRVT
jgi:predicted RNase H-like HicB family nuclease